MPKLSIIIPFYNVEDYIEDCLKSVLEQTIEDIEVILINDASTDRTKSIVEDYAKKDKRIKIIDVETRHCQGYARNRGIEIAQGEYIGFVDSDDFIDKKMFEILYNKAKEDDTDITMCQVSEYDDMNKTYSSSDYYSLSVLEKFGNNVFSADDTKEQLLDINVALWNKIYKREYLLSTGEEFPENFIYEDLPFFFGTYLPAKRINIVWKSLYNYRINRKNSTMQQFNNRILDRSPMVALTYEKLKKLPYFDEIKKEVQGWIINDLFHRYSLLKENFHKEFFFLMKKAFQNLEIEDINDDYWKHVYHFQGYLLVMNNTFEDFNQKVFTEYLDIHKMEDRLRSELADHSELDRRFNLVYKDIEKSFKYAEKLREDSKEQIELLNFQSDEKFSKVYDAVTNSAANPQNNNQNLDINEIIEQKINSLKNKNNEKFEELYNLITENKTNNTEKDTTSNIDIDKVYEIVNSQNEELKERSKLLYNDIKDLSYLLSDNFVELNKEQFKLKEQTEKSFEKIQEDTNNTIQKVNNEYKELVSENVSELLSKITNQEQKYKEETESLKNIIETNKIEYEEVIIQMKSEFSSILQEQQQKHQKEIAELKENISLLELRIKEEIKSPITKIIEKYRKKPAEKEE